jgi:hypothetical protein
VKDVTGSGSRAGAGRRKRRAGRTEFEAGVRTCLLQCAHLKRAGIASLPVHASVKVLVGNEFTYYTRTAGGPTEIGSYLFVTGCAISLRRFPEPDGWEISGSRSWLFKVGFTDLGVCWGSYRRTGGFSPMFSCTSPVDPRIAGCCLKRKCCGPLSDGATLSCRVHVTMASAWFHDRRRLPTILTWRG